MQAVEGWQLLLDIMEKKESEMVEVAIQSYMFMTRHIGDGRTPH